MVHAQPVLHPPPGTLGLLSGFIRIFQNLLATTVTSLISHLSRAVKGFYPGFFSELFPSPSFAFYHIQGKEIACCLSHDCQGASHSCL